MDATLQSLARYVAATSFVGLSPEVVHECRRRVVDGVACAAGASGERYCAKVRTIAGRYAGTPGARMWGSGVRTSMEMAAFANGTMLRYLDYSDTHLGRGAGHPSDMIPALMAVAEAFHKDGASLVAAIVAAYEIYCSLCDAPEKARAFDQATCAAVGSAAGTANLLGLDEGASVQALSLALAPNLHLFNVRRGALSDWKGSAGPNGARNGLFAALLAREGVTGPSAVVEGPGGLAELVGAIDWRVDPAAAPRLMATHIKLHPVCYHGQAAVDAVLKLRAFLPLEAISSVEVETYEGAFLAMGNDPSRWEPATRETADHSLPFAIASVFQDGVLTPKSYAAERLADPSIRSCMRKVSVAAADEMSRAYPRCAPARVTVRSISGQTWSHLQEYPKGHALNPASDAELEGKFIGLWDDWGGEAPARHALGVLWNVDRLDDSAQAVEVLCGGGR